MQISPLGNKFILAFPGNHWCNYYGLDKEEISEWGHTSFIPFLTLIKLVRIWAMIDHGDAT